MSHDTTNTVEIDADALPSASSVSHWCFLGGVSARMLVCPHCDVSWNDGGGSECWVCGRDGMRVRDLRRAARATPAVA